MGKNLILKTLQARKDSERAKEREVEVKRVTQGEALPLA